MPTNETAAKIRLDSPDDHTQFNNGFLFLALSPSSRLFQFQSDHSLSCLFVFFSATSSEMAFWPLGVWGSATKKFAFLNRAGTGSTTGLFSLGTV